MLISEERLSVSLWISITIDGSRLEVYFAPEDDVEERLIDLIR